MPAAPTSHRAGGAAQTALRAWADAFLANTLTATTIKPTRHRRSRTRSELPQIDNTTAATGHVDTRRVKRSRGLTLRAGGELAAEGRLARRMLEPFLGVGRRRAVPRQAHAALGLNTARGGAAPRSVTSEDMRPDEHAFRSRSAAAPVPRARSQGWRDAVGRRQRRSSVALERAAKHPEHLARQRAGNDLRSTKEALEDRRVC
jgi:hypothetical protein